MIARSFLLAVLGLCVPGAQATVCMHKNILQAVLSSPQAIFMQSLAGSFASNDGGRTWHVASEFSGQSFSTRMATAQGSVHALSKDGVLLTSRDNGSTWKEQKDRIGLANISASRNVLYACAGDNRTVLKWNARNARWAPVGRAISPPDSGYLRGPECDQVDISGRRITAYGNETYFHSRDGGRTWRGVVAPDYPHPYLADGESGLHVDDRGVMYSTRVTRSGKEPTAEAYSRPNGGRSWRPLPTRIVGELAGTWHRVQKVVGRDVYLMSMAGMQPQPVALFRSRQGGLVDKLLDLTEYQKLGSFHQIHVAEKTLMVVMSEGLLLSTDDGGTWRQVPTHAVSRAHDPVCS